MTPVVRIASIGSMKMMIFNPQVSLLELARDYPPDFAGERIETFPEEEFREIEMFTEEYYWCGMESINVFEVRGTRHPDYQGLSWVEFLRQGKRMHANLSLFEKNPDYYLIDRKKEPSMSYIKLDGKLYVDSDGNHRTCIAKFFFYYTGRTHLHGVELREVRVDKYTYGLFKELRDYIRDSKLSYLEVEPLQRKLKRVDGPGWMREYFELGIRVRDRRKNKDLELKGSQIIGFFKSIEGRDSLKRRFLGILR